ncbi:MAG: copper chaperone PCu(A)C [Gemmatimonadetes bacterium]|nr:copper chaperone PCu(A)C [Gemmatimonadota bacterium]
MMRSSFLSGALLLTAAVCAPLPAFGQAASTTVTVRDAWIRETPAGRTVTAAFMVLENAGAAARSVVKASAEVAETLELHEMKRDGASMSMSPVKAIEVPAKGNVELRPGGLHVMMFGVRKPLAAGEAVSLVLTLDDGSVVTVPARVRAMPGMQGPRP